MPTIGGRSRRLHESCGRMHRCDAASETRRLEGGESCHGSSDRAPRRGPHAGCVRGEPLVPFHLALRRGGRELRAGSAARAARGADARLHRRRAAHGRDGGRLLRVPAHRAKGPRAGDQRGRRVRGAHRGEPRTGPRRGPGARGAARGLARRAAPRDPPGGLPPPPGSPGDQPQFRRITEQALGTWAHDGALWVAGGFGPDAVEELREWATGRGEKDEARS